MRGVFVLGMHRGGTSAVTRAINLLGVPIGRTEDLQPPKPENPTGFWESTSLTEVNEEILERFGGSWVAPPMLAPDWIRDARLEKHRERGREAFSRVYATETWVWKDPRNSITLPWWLDTLDVQPVVVLVQRNP